MQKKKIFIEISVPSPVKRRILKKIAEWGDLPVKWSREESLHIVVAFVGYVDESVLPEICQRVSEACQKIESFDLDFVKIVLNPDPLDPRIVSLVGEASEELRLLNRAVEEALGTNRHEHKEFSPQITLGKIRKIKWDELNEKPVINETYKTVVPVDSVEIMESKGGGEEYVLVEQCPLA